MKLIVDPESGMDVDSDSDEESQVEEFTRLIIEGSKKGSNLEDLGTDPDRLKVAECIAWVAGRTCAEGSRDVLNVAGVTLMWSETLQEMDEEAVPPSAGRIILVHGLEQLREMRLLNHKNGRCSCGPLGAPDSETPVCGYLGMVRDGGHEAVDDYKPTMDLADIRKWEQEQLDNGGWSDLRDRAAGPDITLDIVSDILWKTVRRYLAELRDTLAESDLSGVHRLDYDTWHGALYEGQRAETPIKRSMLVCLLFSIWTALRMCRMRNHDIGLCSCNENAPEGAPECGHGRARSAAD